MPTVPLYNVNGEQLGEFQLHNAVFGIEPNPHVLHDAVVMQLASQRRGTHAVKNRARVRGGGRKPWRQKGTGRARQGSIRAPQWVGGGTVFGPIPRSYAYKLPKKVRRLALKSALSTKVKENACIVLDELKLTQPKTKEMVGILKNLHADRKVLLVSVAPDENLLLSTRNIPGVKVVDVYGMNVLDLLNHDRLIMTRDAATQAGEVFGQ